MIGHGGEAAAVGRGQDNGVVPLRAEACPASVSGACGDRKGVVGWCDGQHTALAREDVDSSEALDFDPRDSERCGHCNRAGATLACGRFGVVLLEGVVAAAEDSSESSSICAEHPIGIIAR